ncbi:MAG: Ig domain-containing protein [Eubacterium sp.]|nr:Ig domain-containing protein [Eubacterium sp.]
MKRYVLRMVVAIACMLCLTISVGVPTQAAQLPRLNLKSLDLTKGTTFTIRVYNLADDETASFKSTDLDVCSIESTAEDKKSVVIYGKAVGKANLKVKIKKNGIVTSTLKCRIKVAPVPVSIKFTESTINLIEGRQYFIDAIIKPYSATETPVFESSNEDVAVVNVRGLVTAVAPGRATITATLLSTGKTATCTVVVKESTGEE